LQQSGQFICAPSRIRLAFSRNILLQPGQRILTLSSMTEPSMKGAMYAGGHYGSLKVKPKM